MLLLMNDLVHFGVPSFVAVLAAFGSLGALVAAIAALALLRQNRRLLAAQASKAEAEGGGSMVAAAISLAKAVREEEEGCRKRLVEMSDKQEAGIKERISMVAKINELDHQLRWLEKLLSDAGIKGAPA